MSENNNNREIKVEDGEVSGKNIGANEKEIVIFIKRAALYATLINSIQTVLIILITSAIK